jgi:hypothetical protein
MSEFRRILRTPILDWSDIKVLAPRLSTQPPAVVDQVGCWSTRPQGQGDPVHATHLMDHLGLDVTYTRVPSRAFRPAYENDPHVALFPLAELIYPVHPNDNPDDNSIMEESRLGAKIRPDTHMACLDNLYYATVGTQSWEWNTPWSPVWRTVGRHLRFTDSVMMLTKGYIQRAFRTPIEDVPPVNKDTSSLALH